MPEVAERVGRIQRPPMRVPELHAVHVYISEQVEQRGGQRIQAVVPAAAE